jgi:protein-S-isoprenylcysteine O-methyltransferase Ste14
MSAALLGHLAFAIALAAAALLAGFLIVALVIEGFAFWPPPKERCWQDYVFWGLFRLHWAAIALTAVLDGGTLEWEHWSRLAVGVPMLAGFLGLTLYGYGFLGLDNTYGRRAGLVTGGLYAYSRNPQYLASVAATIGLAITFNSPLTLLLAAVLMGLYALFALNEERWLMARYGRAYAEYAARVPRFLDLRSFARAGRVLAERL